MTTTSSGAALEQFSRTECTWKHCIYFLENSKNEYLILFCLNILENIISFSWSRLASDDCVQLKTFICDYLFSNHAALPVFFRNKLVLMFVLIGRCNWPDADPEFMDTILQLGKTDRQQFSLCLLLLQTVSEELATPKKDSVLSKRRKELMSLLLKFVPAIFNIITEILDAGLQLNPLVTDKSTCISAPGFQLFKFLLPVEVLRIALNCICHYLSWVPPTCGFSSNMIGVLFKYCFLGCFSGLDSADDCGTLSALAMDSINELMIRKFVPKNLEHFYSDLYEHIFVIMQKLVDDGNNVMFSRLDERYLSKCGDFWDYFVSSHLKRMELNHHFPILEYLAVFYKYTFKHTEMESYCVCLATWHVFLDHLISRLKESSISESLGEGVGRYKNILVTMTESVLKKAQFHYNSTELYDIDDDTLDDNETEWQSFVRQNLKFVEKVFDLFPLDVLNMIVPLFEEYSQVYLSFSQCISIKGEERFLNIESGEQLKSVHAVLKDLTTILQALGRISHYYLEENFEKRKEAHQLMNRFCVLAKYCTDTAFHEVETMMPEILNQGFIEVHCQVFGTIVTFLQWLSEFQKISLLDQQNIECLHFYIASIIESAIPLISIDVPEKICIAAAGMFESVASNIKSSLVYQNSLIQSILFGASEKLFDSIPSAVSSSMYNAIVSLLVLPWVDVKENCQDWDGRISALQLVMKSVTDPFHHLVSSQFQQSLALEEQGKHVIKKTLILLQSVLTKFSNATRKSKEMLFKSVESCVALYMSLPLLHMYIESADIMEHLMGFLLVLFKDFNTLLQAGVINEITRVFMSLITRDHIEKTIFTSGSVGCQVLVRFIDLLKYLVQDNHNIHGTFLSSIISFSMKELYPALKEKNLPEVKCPFYSLLFHILLDNWRYFFPESLLMHLKTKEEHLHNEIEFFSIFEAFGDSLLQTDINVFHHNLIALKQLNAKKHLFTMKTFLSFIWEAYLTILLQVLMLKSHELYEDDIVELIYNIAIVDFPKFQTQFLPQFIGNITQLSDTQKCSAISEYQLHEDFPSFSQNITQLITDVNYYLKYNIVQS